MVKYVNGDELRYQVLISNGKGYPTKELDQMFDILIDSLILKFYLSEIDKCVYRRNSKRLLNDWWKHYNCDKYNDTLPYFSEITKRAIQSTRNMFDRAKRDYYNEELMKLRTTKLRKLNILK